MDDQRLGSAIRGIRLRRHWRQRDLAAKSGVSASTISRLERGHVGEMSIRSLRAVSSAIDVRVDVVPRWRAGDLDRMLNARHSALHETVARWFRATNPAWVLAPEVTFAIYSDRGVMDLLAWHPGRRAVLVIELKTDIVDLNELLGILDRKRRVARQVARERGWDASTVSTWLIVTAGRTNRRRLEAHRAMVGNALPAGSAGIRRWLRDPNGTIDGVSSWSVPGGAPGSASIRRVRAVERSPPAQSASGYLQGSRS